MPLLSFFPNDEHTLVSNNTSHTAISIKNRRLSSVKRFGNRKVEYTTEEALSNWTKTWNLLKQLADILAPSKKVGMNRLGVPTSDDSFYGVSTESDTDTDAISFFTTKTSLSNSKNKKTVDKSPICELFPKKSNIQNFNFTSVTPCSMNIHLMENPIQLEALPNGMISSTLSNKQAFQTAINNQNSIINTNTNTATNNNSNNNNNTNTNLPLPISPQSNNSPTALDHKLTPQSTISSGTVNSFLNFITKTNGNVNSNSNSSSNYQTSTSERDEPGLLICHYCDATFRIRGYLTRHIKKHAIEKAYHCPFYDKNLPSELRCHNSGGFSRRDTYKTHLKARHFTFPDGIKAHNRNKSDGQCSHCGQHFINADDWINNHLETGKCVKLPEEYLIKLKEKSNNKKRTHHKLKMIKTSTGHSRFVSTAESVIEQKVFQNKEALEAIAIVAGDSMNNHVLSKNDENQFVLNSENFEGHKKPKKKYKPRRNKQMINSDIGKATTKDNISNTPKSNLDSISPHSHISNIDELDLSCINNNGNNGNNNNQTMNGVHSFITSPNNSMFSSITATNKNDNNPVTISLPMNINDSSYLEQQGSLVSSSVINTFAPITATSSISSMSSVSSIFLEPLDIEQQSMYEPFEEATLHAIPNTHTNDISHVNMNKLKTVPNNDAGDTFGKGMDCNKLNEMQMKETRQYLNFYNFFFGSNL